MTGVGDRYHKPTFYIGHWHREVSFTLRSGLITLHRPDCDPPHILLFVIWTGRRAYNLHTNMRAFSRRWTAEPVAANNAIAVAVESPNPVYNALVTCGITNAAHRDVIMNIEGLDSILAAFTSMNGDPDVTEMATRMASRPNAAAGRVILGTMQIKRLQDLVYWVKTTIDVE
jgi:hypothetical protein